MNGIDIMQQQLDPPARSVSNARGLAEDLLAILGVLKRGWRFIAISVAICQALAIAYLAKAKPVHQASARLLVLQQGGRIVSVPGSSSDPLQSIQGTNDSLSTHVMIIRSPVIVEQALASAGLRNLTAGAVIDRLSVMLPDPEAKIIQIDYKAKAGTGDEAVKIVTSIIISYDNFLKFNYHKNTSDFINLITKARDELSKDLQRLERDYLEFRQQSPAYTAGKDGRSFVTRRLDQWDQAANQVLTRALQLQSQLELGRKLAGEGASAAAIAHALSQLGGMAGNANIAPTLPEVGGPPDLSEERLEAELDNVEFQRLTATRLLDRLRAEQTASASSREVGDEEITDALLAEPDAAGLVVELRRARMKRDQVKRLARHANDPAVIAAQQQVRTLEEEFNRLLERRRPTILARLSQAVDDGAARKAKADLTALRVREETLRERLHQVKTDRLRRLRQELEQLATLHGPQDSKVQQLQEQIAQLEGKTGDKGRSEQAQTRALLNSIEQSLKSIEMMRAKIQQRFERDLAESKQAEIGLLAESNLCNNLERQRILFNSVVDQLKQARLTSDLGSITAQIINPPRAKAVRPQVAFVLVAALVIGSGLGGATVFVADLLDARIRTLAEMCRVLDLRVLGVVPQLSREEYEAVEEIALISHAVPRSLLSESYRSIRTSLLGFLRHNQNAQLILVTSPLVGDGKSTIASNLAISLSHAGRKVLLIDGDLRCPSLHRIYNLRQDRGLTHVLKGLLPLHQAVQPASIKNLELLAAGPEVSNPAELLASHRLGELAEEVRRIYDIVIFDSSPLLTVADPSILASVIDGIVLVARVSVTRRREAEWALELLRIPGTPVLGSVINRATREQIGYGYGTNGVVRPAKGDGYSTSGPRDVMRERPALDENWRQQLERARTQADRAEPTNGTIDRPATG
ncbi:MAG: polysaccharide biosynthesis tyrosine autokinase [Planctomycetaceae bacterium]|nr:polysaccharide biosynthesis tyrosine autokinase [Planctomycetaceae bacterium]